MDHLGQPPTLPGKPTEPHSQTPLSKKKREWEDYKDILCKLSSQGVSDKQLEFKLRAKGFETNASVINKHLNAWGCSRYLKDPLRGEFIQQLRQSNDGKCPPPDLTSTQIRVLKRHIKETNPPYGDKELLVKLLSEIIPCNNELTSGSYATGLPDDRDRIAMAEQSHSVDDCWDDGSLVSTLSFDLDVLDLASEDAALMEDDLSGNTGSKSSSKSATAPPVVQGTGNLQPISGEGLLQSFHNKLQAIDKLGLLTKAYYQRLLHEHTVSTDFTIALTQNRTMWTNIKSAIYYWKVPKNHGGNNYSLARTEFSKVGQKLFSVVRSQPFPLLKDMHSTLAPAAMGNTFNLRTEILREYRQAARHCLGPTHTFTQICDAMVENDGSDELSVTVLRIMLYESELVLPAEHPELFELHRALIRLYRRTREYVQAEEAALTLIQKTIGLQARLALTEYVYILCDQGRYEEALPWAEGVNDCAKRDLGQGYPDEKAIYGMEDIADICEKLGRTEDSIHWLRQAFPAALSIWGDSPSTIHIWEKLEAGHEKRLALVMERLHSQRSTFENVL